MYDHRTQRPRGFGFISYESEDAVDRVLRRTFHELNGKMVEVKLAVPKDPIRNQMNVNGFGSGRISALLMNEYSQGFSTSPVSSYGVKPEVRYSPGVVNRGGFSPFGHGYGIDLNFEQDGLRWSPKRCHRWRAYLTPYPFCKKEYTLTSRSKLKTSSTFKNGDEVKRRDSNRAKCKPLRKAKRM